MRLRGLFFHCLFIYSWLCWVFVAAQAVSSCGEWGLLRSCGSRASHWGGLSCCRGRALEHRLSGCGAQALLLCGIWDLPRSGIEPVSPALAGKFFTTELPGKPPRGLLVGLCICTYMEVSVAQFSLRLQQFKINHRKAFPSLLPQSHLPFSKTAAWEIRYI